MANIKLKSLITEAEDFQARSKQTGKLVHFKSKDAYQAALKAGTHEDPKAKKGEQPKAAAKPNDMFGGDYAKDRGGEAPKESPKINSKNWKPDEDGSMSDEAADDVQNYLNNVLGADGLAEVDYNTGNIQYGLADSENSIFVGYSDGTYNVSFEGPSMDLDKMNQSYKSFKNPKEALQYAGELAKLNLNGGEAPKADTPKTSNDKGDSGFGWGPETDRKKATGLPKKASQLNYKHAEVLEKALNAEAGLDGYVDTDDNTDAIMFHGTNTASPTYTIYFGGNADYGKPDEFRVSLLPTYENDPSGLGDGNVDKTFKSAEEAMAFAVEIAKKYKKELQMDDDEVPTDEPKVRPQSKVQDFVKNLSGKQYKEFAFDNDIDHRDPMEMQDFIQSLSDEEAEKILKKYGKNESTKLTSMIKK